MKNIAILAALLAASSSANAQLKVTEIMYTGLFGEFVECTNKSGSSLDVTDYSFDDSSNTPGSVVFPSVTLAADQCVIITEVSSTIFNQAWYTEPTSDPSITNAPVIIANNTHNLGRSDTVYIYDDADDLVDQVTYNDQAGNGPRTEDVSAVPKSAWNYLLPNMTNSGTADWFLSTSVSGSWKAGVAGAPGPTGNPGVPYLY